MINIFYILGFIAVHFIMAYGIARSIGNSFNGFVIAFITIAIDNIFGTYLLIIQAIVYELVTALSREN